MKSPYTNLMDDHKLTLEVLGGPKIEMNLHGFFYNGNLIADDKEIYLKFKEWITIAHKIEVEDKED